MLPPLLPLRTSNVPVTTTIERHLHHPPQPLPPPPLQPRPPPLLLLSALSIVSRPFIDEKSGSSTTTTSVPVAAPTWKHLQVQTTWTYLTYKQYLKCMFLVPNLTIKEYRFLDKWRERWRIRIEQSGSGKDAGFTYLANTVFLSETKGVERKINGSYKQWLEKVCLLLSPANLPLSLWRHLVDDLVDFCQHPELSLMTFL